MSNLFCDIGYKSINHFGEQLCGDHVDMVTTADGDHVVVLADGLGSGVKASILSTLTSKIISTMLGNGMSLEDCVETIAATLPICSERHVAYSTFTIIRIHQNEEAQIIQFDNPLLILLRNGHNYNYPKKEVELAGKKILVTDLRLHENDTLIMMSDGCPYAGSTPELNYNWQRSDIITYMETLAPLGYNAKALSADLVDECNRLYAGKPGDDTTSCVVKMIRRHPVNLFFGPPREKENDEELMKEFFSAKGTHITCGGTTASVAARYLKKDVKPLNSSPAADVPPMSTLEGVDLCTEGIITLRKALSFIEDYAGDNARYNEWAYSRDGASLITRELAEEATDITIYAGGAVNPAHQIDGFQIGRDLKDGLVETLRKTLESMGKNVTVKKC